MWSDSGAWRASHTHAFRCMYASVRARMNATNTASSSSAAEAMETVVISCLGDILQVGSAGCKRTWAAIYDWPQIDAVRRDVYTGCQSWSPAAKTTSFYTHQSSDLVTLLPTFERTTFSGMEQLIDHAGHVQLEQQESQHVLSTERSVEPPPNSAEIDAANPNPADLLPEADGAARDPYSVKRWLSWAEAVRRSEQPAASEFSVLERAVAALPGSYKLWQLYATRAHMIARAYHPEHASRELSVNVALRAARALRTAPRLWEEAISICEREGRLAAARVALDDALRALPVTQHDRIWRTALSGISALPSRASVSVLERYQTLRPLLAALPLFDARVRARKWDAAVSGLLRVLAANPTWVPVGDRTRGELWVAAMHLAVQHPAAVVSVDAPMLLRNALREGPDAAHGLQTADLYKLLARYHMRLGRFDDARAVYEEA
eukprot:IDg13436t1